MPTKEETICKYFRIFGAIVMGLLAISTIILGIIGGRELIRQEGGITWLGLYAILILPITGIVLLYMTFVSKK